MEGTKKVDLIKRWMKDGLTGTLSHGEDMIQDPLNAFLLESFRNGDLVLMRDEICKELINLFKTKINPIMFLELDGIGLMKALENEAWEEANEMHLMNNKISKVPENPDCPKLSVLFLTS